MIICDVLEGARGLSVMGLLRFMKSGVETTILYVSNPGPRAVVEGLVLSEAEVSSWG